MIALYNFVPKRCPNCLVEADFLKDKKNFMNFQMRNMFTCECGLSFQKCNTGDLLEAAQNSGGDLHEKVKEHNGDSKPHDELKYEDVVQKPVRYLNRGSSSSQLKS